ncbi:MAG: metallopeptidase [Nanoarchaeota archaeon]|nr:metallopeptidase [Nanoarchaeota archaeon]MCG2700506.1 metallopeptidase [Candidatus Parcubacteria bacterium]
MKYEFAEDLQEIAEEISRFLFPHVQMNRVRCLRSYGTSSRRTIARCHALGKLMQKAMGIKAVYALEFLSERFDKLSKENQVKVIIHELMHIPKTFGGGFKHHDFVCEKNVELHYETYKAKKKEVKNADWFKL